MVESRVSLVRSDTIETALAQAAAYRNLGLFPQAFALLDSIPFGVSPTCETELLTIDVLSAWGNRKALEDRAAHWLSLGTDDARRLSTLITGRRLILRGDIGAGVAFLEAEVSRAQRASQDRLTGRLLYELGVGRVRQLALDEADVALRDARAALDRAGRWQCAWEHWAQCTYTVSSILPPLASPAHARFTARRGRSCVISPSART
jgi:hypothetical protein